MTLLRVGVDTVGAIPVSMMGGGTATLGAAPAYRDKVMGYGPIAYWMQAEAAGIVAIDEVNSPLQDGAYTGVTLGQPGIGDGNTCPLFDGANDFNDVQTGTFAGAFDGQEGTLLVWARVSGAGVWTDGATRRVATFYLTNNRVQLLRHSVNNRMHARYEANSVSKDNFINGLSSTDWMCWVLTWSLSADAFKVYLGGVQQGLTLNGLGTWAGNPTVSRIGAWLGPIQVWDGWLAHCAVWDTALGQPAITDLAVV